MQFGVVSEYRGLRALDLAEELAVQCRLEADGFPPRAVDLADQLRRAATGAALNIAEGATRSSFRDQRRFFDSARGSLKEVEVILRIARRTGLIPGERAAELEALRVETARTLFGLLRSVTNRLERGETIRKPA